MKEYKVWAKVTSYCYLPVEAETEDEALKKAEDADGADFIPTEEGDWDIMEAVED